MVDQTLSNPQRRVVAMGGYRLPPAVAKHPAEQAGAAARGDAHNPVVSDAINIGTGDRYSCAQPQRDLLAALRRAFHITVGRISAVANTLSNVIRRVAKVSVGGITRRIPIRTDSASSAQELDGRAHQGHRVNADLPRHSYPPSVIHHAKSKHSARERCRHQALALMERRREAERAECLARWRAWEPLRPHCAPVARASSGEST
jgi:hypothetical protein